MKSPKELSTLANLLGGVPILGVLPGSPAARAGLQYGDIVLRVNGIQTETFVEFLRAHEGGQRSLELDVFRNGTNLTLSLSGGYDRVRPLEEAKPREASHWSLGAQRQAVAHKLS